MRASITFATSILALATIATGCASAGRSTGKGKVYLVGVAGGG